MIGPTSRNNWLTFSGDPVPDTDSKSLFNFSHHCRIGNFRKFISVSHTVNGRFSQHSTTFDKLQRAQNNLARVVCQSRGCTNARPLLRSLHCFRWGSGSPIKWLYLLARCGPQPLQRISASWYRPMHHLGLCAHPMLRCWSILAYTPNWRVALFLLLLHPLGTEVKTSDYSLRKRDYHFELPSWHYSLFGNSLSFAVFSSSSTLL